MFFYFVTTSLLLLYFSFVLSKKLTRGSLRQKNLYRLILTQVEKKEEIENYIDGAQ